MRFTCSSPKDWPELAPLSLRLVIMSRIRPRAIDSHRLFPKASGEPDFTFAVFAVFAYVSDGVRLQKGAGDPRSM